MAKIKVSEWLSKHTDSHTIHDDAKLRSSFKKHTGINAPAWPVSTVGEIRKQIASDPRGGYVQGDDAIVTASGYVVATFLADLYGTDKNRRYRQMMGRGFAWQAAIESIRDAGN